MMTGIHHLLQPYTVESKIFPMKFSSTIEQKDYTLLGREELAIS